VLAIAAWLLEPLVHSYDAPMGELGWVRFLLALLVFGSAIIKVSGT